MNDYQHALSYGKSEDSILNKFNPNNEDDSIEKTFAEWNVKIQLATAYYNLRMPDSAWIYAKQLKAILSVMNRDTELNPYYSNATNKLFGDISVAKGDTKTALSYYQPIMNISRGPLDAEVNEGMAKLFQKEGRTDSALIYAKRALTYYQTQKKEVQAWAGESPNYFIAEISPLIAQIYKANGQLDSA
jgi:hypothetical protein